MSCRSCIHPPRLNCQFCRSDYQSIIPRFKRLIDHINGDPKYAMSIRFGTLSEYFDQIGNPDLLSPALPTVGGDFFIYRSVFCLQFSINVFSLHSDKKDHMWSGYFTSRPFGKQLARTLETNLRAAELLYSFAKGPDSLYPRLQYARQTHAIFMHHDSIPGTSREAPTQKMYQDLTEALKATVAIQESTLSAMLRGRVIWPKTCFKTGQQVLVFHARATTSPRVVRFCLLMPPAGKAIFLASAHIPNSVLGSGVELWDDTTGVMVPMQLTKLTAGKLSAVFQPTFSGLSITTFTIREKKSRPLEVTPTLYRATAPVVIRNPYFRISVDTETGTAIVSGGLSVTPGSYAPDPGRSGAYLMRHLKQKVWPVNKPTLKLVEGPILSSIDVLWPDDGLGMKYTLYHESYLSRAVSLEHWTNTTQPRDSSQFITNEIFLRLQTNSVQSDRIFYTDNSGFQMQKRSFASQYGREGNYFPVSNQAYIQDNKSRLTVVVSRSHGATSTKPGELEIMLDRTTATEDGEGEMKERLGDETFTVGHMWILQEAISGSDKMLPSLLARQLALGPTAVSPFTSSDPVKARQLLPKPWPCNFELLNLRTLSAARDYGAPSRTALLVLHRMAVACADEQVCEVGELPELPWSRLEPMTLTGTASLKQESLKLQPFDLRTFRVHL